MQRPPEAKPIPRARGMGRRVAWRFWPTRPVGIAIFLAFSAVVLAFSTAAPRGTVPAASAVDHHAVVVVQQVSGGQEKTTEAGHIPSLHVTFPHDVTEGNVIVVAVGTVDQEIQSIPTNTVGTQLTLQTARCTPGGSGAGQACSYIYTGTVAFSGPATIFAGLRNCQSNTCYISVYAYELSAATTAGSATGAASAGQAAIPLETTPVSFDSGAFLMSITTAPLAFGFIPTIPMLVHYPGPGFQLSAQPSVVAAGAQYSTAGVSSPTTFRGRTCTQPDGSTATCSEAQFAKVGIAIAFAPPAPIAAPTTTTVSFGTGPFVFNGSAFTATATVSPADAGDAIITYTGDCTNVGSTCTATATYPGSTNYLGSSDTATITIVRAPVTATAGGGSGTYDGAAQSPSVCAVTGAYIGNLACANDPASVGPDAGTTTIAPVVSGDTSNFEVTTVNGSFTIAPAATTTTVAFGTGPFVFNGSAFTATATVDPAAAGTADIVYSGDCVSPGDTCTATATYPGSTNYLGSSDTATITIVPGYYLCGSTPDTSAVRQGATILVKVAVCDIHGVDVGGASLQVVALGVSPSGALDGAGSANAGDVFRYGAGVYTYNLQTRNLAPGDYTLDFTVGNDPTIHHYAFTIQPRVPDHRSLPE